LFLTADDISRALTAYEQNLSNGVISLAFCRDYPCQFKAFFNFLGCAIMRLNENRSKNVALDRLQLYSPDEQTCKTKSTGEITIKLFDDGAHCCISFYSENLPGDTFIAQILPFSKDGPLYKKSQEILIKVPEYEIRLDINNPSLTGIILIFTMPAQSGEYDTMEFFTPENAPWELGESVSTVFNKISHEPMCDRQQFPPAYTYDGSFSVLSAEHLPDTEKTNLFPLILKDSCIVTDWVEYWYAVTSQQNTAELES
jgi:hypothetical protein